MVIEEDRAAKERKPDAFIRSVQPSLDHQAGTSGHFETVMKMCERILINQNNPLTPVPAPAKYQKSTDNGGTKRQAPEKKFAYDPNLYCNSCTMVGHDLEKCNAKDHFCNTCKVIGHNWKRCPQNPNRIMKPVDEEAAAAYATAQRRRGSQMLSSDPSNHYLIIKQAPAAILRQ